MGWHLSLADLWTLGGGFKTATGIGVLKAEALGSSTASIVPRHFKIRPSIHSNIYFLIAFFRIGDGNMNFARSNLFTLIKYHIMTDVSLPHISVMDNVSLFVL